MEELSENDEIPIETSTKSPILSVIYTHKRNFTLVILYSFFLWFLPSEPYLVDLLEQKGFTTTQIYQDIFPIWTYSYCIFVILFGILGELISYKMCIILGTLGLFIASVILILPITYTEYNYYYYLMIFDEFSEGIGSASSSVFISFIFLSFPTHFYATIVRFSLMFTLFLFLFLR